MKWFRRWLPVVVLFICCPLWTQTTVLITGNIKSSSSAVVTWQDGGGNTVSYNVKRSEIQGGPYATIQTGVVTTQFTDLGCRSGHTYYYVISSVNAAGESANSDEAGPARIP